MEIKRLFTLLLLALSFFLKPNFPSVTQKQSKKSVHTHTKKTSNPVRCATRASRRAMPVDEPVEDHRDPLTPIVLNKISLTKKGVPTIAAIRNLIKMYWPELGNIIIKEGTPGSNSKKIFLIFANNDLNKLVFVCKISGSEDDDEEAALSPCKNLVEVQKKIIARVPLQHDYPYLTPIVQLFSYRDNTDVENIIEVTQGAQGIALEDMLEGKKETTFSTNDIIAIASSIGKTLGKFHQLFMRHFVQHPSYWRTYIHGDFHTGNVFANKIDETDFAVSLIDNETMYHSIQEPKSILWDIAEFIMVPLLYTNCISPDVLSDGLWATNIHFYAHFVRGYIASFPINKQAILGAYIKHHLRDWFTEAQHSIEKVSRGTTIEFQEDKAKEWLNSDIKKLTWDGFGKALNAMDKETLPLVSARLLQAIRIICPVS